MFGIYLRQLFIEDETAQRERNISRPICNQVLTLLLQASEAYITQSVQKRKGYFYFYSHFRSVGLPASKELPFVSSFLHLNQQTRAHAPQSRLPCILRTCFFVLFFPCLYPWSQFPPSSLCRPPAHKEQKLNLTRSAERAITPGSRRALSNTSSALKYSSMRLVHSSIWSGM